jgi:hypothetical protein
MCPIGKVVAVVRSNPAAIIDVTTIAAIVFIVD